MGRIYDALKRAEAARWTEAPGRTEPALVVDDSVPVAREPGVSPAESPTGANGRVHAEPVVASALRPAPSVLPVVAAPNSAAADRIRAVQVSLLRAMSAAGHQTLLVTSPGRGDGKSVMAANLALVLAKDAGCRVLLVDGDLRKPAVPGLFGVPAGPGLAETLARGAVWRQCVLRAPWNELDLLPAGRAGDAAALLVSPAAQAVLDDMRAAYDVVVIDSPPILAVAETTAMAGLADAVLLVAREGHTPREALAEAARALDPGKLVGVVLNAVRGGPLGGSRYYAY